MEDWALKYRPKTFDDVVGQKVNTHILESTIEDPYHTLIFQGASGCGKTTCARIYANAIKAHIIEVDAASNNGVDNMREILDLVRLSPLSNKYRAVVVDEAHMLSRGAWNAALKAIEEPNDSTIWIFCTTEFNKIPNTIRGRSVMFKFYPVKEETIIKRLKYILEQEGKELNEEILTLLARNCKGQVRDAVKNLQQCVYSEVETEKEFNKLFGIPDIPGMRAYIESVLSGDPKNGLDVLNRLDSNTDFIDWKKRLETLLQDMVYAYFRIKELPINDKRTKERLLEVAERFSPRLFGLMLDKLARITESEDARTRLMTLCMTGVE